MNAINKRVEKLEEKQKPRARRIVFIQDYGQPNIYRTLTNDGAAQRDVTADQARAMITPLDLVTWIEPFENRIRHEGPGSEFLNRGESEGEDENDTSKD